MARTVLEAVLAAAVALVLGAPAAHAATPPFPPSSCATYGDERICTAEVPSFDGSPLDADLTLPSGEAPGGGKHPLIVLLHGFGNDKHEWESLNDTGDGADKYHWNSHWFSQRGYYVLTYTARGFRSKSASEPYQPDTPAGSSAQLPSGTIQLKSRTAEIHDTQWLAALVAQEFPDVDTNRVAVSGGSYGGGESWMQATEPEWTFPHEQDPSLPVLHLRVAVPKYGWTDLGYALAPGGHGPSPYDVSTGHPDSPTGDGFPIGAVKYSYVNGFLALGAEDGIFESGTRTPPTQGDEGPISIVPGWSTRLVDVGDPYDTAGAEDPIVAQARRGLTEFRGAYYQPDRWRAEADAGDEVAIFAIQGWTDDLFPAAESFRAYHQLEAIDPHWPIEVALGSVGHSHAQNKPSTWHWLNSLANGFLRGHLDPGAGADSGVISERTECNDDGASQRVAARDPEDLANSTWTLTFEPGTLDPKSGLGDPDSLATDPIVGPALFPDSCRVSQAPAFPGRYTDRTPPLAQQRTYVGVGSIRLDYTLTQPTTTTVIARLWDEAPDHTAVLVDRGIYRIDPPAYDSQSGTLTLPLNGDHWTFPAGHRIRLDLQQVDTPTFEQPNVPNTVTFGPPQLRLPVLEGAG